MLRIIQNTSAAGAKSYYSTADYYSEGQELAGIWRGKGAGRLCLSGTIDKAAWDALCDNRNPVNGERLTARRKADRRIGYDFNFHVHKSVSILYGITGDERIVDAFRESVNETMQEMEREMKTRVRAGGKNEDRVSGEMLWGEYVHFTSRPVDGVPDPHLHCHCFVHNVTFDAKEGRWKAGQFAELKRDAPYFQAKFQGRMASKLMDLGLPIERTSKGWEVAGVPGSAIKNFSRRTALIEDEAKSKGITDPAQKSELGAKTRQRKQKNLTMEELRKKWLERLSDDERSGIAETAKKIGSAPIRESSRSADKAAKLAISHLFERKSVVPERTLLAEAMKRCAGEVTVEAAEAAVREQDIIVGEKDGRRLATTRTVLAEEQRMIDFARNGRGSREPLGDGAHVFRREWLNDGQKQAVEHVLGSTDRVILIRGVAGTGKTTMMMEAAEAIEASGKHVFTFAPSADASRGVLRDAGFKDAETVARLLKDEKLQERIRDQIMWIDEASLVGSKTLGQVFDLADKLDARVILSGDRRQHGSVERGAALRLLETEAGLIPAEIKSIQRQKADYRDAVKALSEGRVASGFEQLDRLGWIKEVADGERYKLLADDYVSAVRAGKTALVVAPSHREGEWVSDSIRQELQQCNKLGSEQRQFRVLHNANLTAADRADALSYDLGDVLVFHQNAPGGFRKGERVEVGKARLPLDQAERFTVFHPDVLPVAPGDVIRITRNDTTRDGKHRLNNGALFTVNNFTKEGHIRLSNGWVIDKEFGHFTHGYCVTSQASQGKTVDRVIAAMSSASFPATTREGFYVTVSRGREAAHIYTDDKTALLEAVGHSDDKLSALELVSDRDHRERDATVRRMERQRQAERDVARPGPEREGMTYER